MSILVELAVRLEIRREFGALEIHSFQNVLDKSVGDDVGDEFNTFLSNIRVSSSHNLLNFSYDK